MGVLPSSLCLTRTDLDTIDLSNLNRQFLFRPEHLGRPKALVAAEAVRAFNPGAELVPHHANVKDERFGVEFVRGFDVVLNALDNVEARRHVNRLCLAAEVPLFDAGTTGYVGQVTVIRKGDTACYDCKPKATQKVFPVCTIRSTPDKPVHCIVWAKELFRLLFGSSADSMLFEDPQASEPSVYMHLLRLPPGADPASPGTFLRHGEALLRALFRLDVEKRLAADAYKNALRVPRPMEELSISESVAGAAKVLDGSPLNSLHCSVDSPTDIWTVTESGVRFILTFTELFVSYADRLGSLEFDKDLSLAMQFVCAASNLRSAVFGIEQLSLHDCKGIAGNIVPAIATTNAIVAGIQVMQAVKWLTAPADIRRICPYVYCLRSRTRKGLYLQPTEAEPPEKDCFVCSATTLILDIDTTAATLDDLVTKVIKEKMGLACPSVLIASSCIYEEGDDADEALLATRKKLLADCPCGGVKDGSVLTITDFLQDIHVDISVNSRPQSELPEAGFLLCTQSEYSSRKAEENGSLLGSKRKLEDGEDEVY